MVFCSKCGAILTGTVCSRCGGANIADNSKKETENSESVSERPGNNPFSSERPGNSPFSSGSSGKSSQDGNSTANNPFSGTKFGGAFGFGTFGKSGFGNTSYGSKEDVAEQSKNKLISKLTRYQELLTENEELESMIKPQSSFPATEETVFKKRSLIKFFWPFIVAGPVAGYLLYIGSTLITMSSVSSYAYQYETSSEVTSKIMGEAYMGFILGLIVAAAIIIFGLFICKRKQAEFNSKADFMNREASERYQKGLENKRMIDLQQSNIQEMHQYESLVPNDYRTAIRVGKILALIKDGEAETVDAAIEKLKSEPETAPGPDSEPALDLSGIFS